MVMTNEAIRAEVERGAAMFRQIAERLLATLPPLPPMLDDLTKVLNRTDHGPGSTAAVDDYEGNRVELFADAAGEVPIPNPVVADAEGNYPRVFVGGGKSLRIETKHR